MHCNFYSSFKMKLYFSDEKPKFTGDTKQKRRFTSRSCHTTLSKCQTHVHTSLIFLKDNAGKLKIKEKKKKRVPDLTTKQSELLQYLVPVEKMEVPDCHTEETFEGNSCSWRMMKTSTELGPPTQPSHTLALVLTSFVVLSFSLPYSHLFLLFTFVLYAKLSKNSLA